MDRRKFIKNSAIASTSLFVPSFLQAKINRNPAQSRDGKILIIIQLSGGNDGLNTIIPYQNDLYYKARPQLAIPAKELIKIDGELGFNPALEAIRPLYDEGLISVVNNVGYPNPDRSHFRSMDIWHTASNSDEYLSTGWLGRWLDSSCHPCDTPYKAIEVDDNLSLALKGHNQKGFAMSNPNRLKRAAENKFLSLAADRFHPEHADENVRYLYKTLIETQASANYLYEQAKIHKSNISYPVTQFGNDLKQIAELITADTNTSIYYASLTGFDTHANQKNQQARLLKQYADGVAALVKDLKQNNLLKDTLIFTFSEFGRRVKQNASNGTDHGTANNLFIIGEKLQKAGFFNSGPNLQDLDNGDLIYQVDFRQIYATIIENWLENNAEAILNQPFKTLPII